MKNKYQRMNREEKKQCQKFYYNTEKGKEMWKRLNRLVVLGIIGIFFAVFFVISGYISNEINWATWTMAVILLIFSIIFIIGSYKLRIKCLNAYAIKKMQ